MLAGVGALVLVAEAVAASARRVFQKDSFRRSCQLHYAFGNLWATMFSVRLNHFDDEALDLRREQGALYRHQPDEWHGLLLPRARNRRGGVEAVERHLGETRAVKNRTVVRTPWLFIGQGVLVSASNAIVPNQNRFTSSECLIASRE